MYEYGPKKRNEETSSSEEDSEDDEMKNNDENKTPEGESSTEGSTHQVENDTDTMTTRSSTKNYYKEYNNKAAVRKCMERVASQEQAKQAEAVNRYRRWEGGEHLAQGTVCLLKISEEKNSIGIKDLPVVITKVKYYKKSDSIRYKVACKNGHLQGTYSRGELTPQEHVTAKLMGITSADVELNHTKPLKPLQAHSRYLQIGGKQQKCRCKTDCRFSKKCSCREAGRFCTKHCHKNNTNCTLCERDH